MQQNKKTLALQYFSDKFHCSQSVLAAYSQDLGLTERQALKLGGCMGSGLRKGEVCGACLGALMVLGLKYGQSDKNDLTSRLKSNQVSDDFLNMFVRINGSYICNELLGCDLKTKEGLDFAENNNLFTEFCPKIVASAIDILEGLV